MHNNMKKDLEELSGSLFQGNLTPIVYDLIKDTIYKEECLAYLGKKVEHVEESVDIKPAQDFKTWFESFKEVK